MIIYTTEDGTSYTKKEIQEEILHFMNWKDSWVWELSNRLKSKGFKNNEIVDILYNYVMNVISWEHPATILDQIDEDTVDYILENIIKRREN